MSGYQGFAFGDCILDLRRGALLRAGAEVPLRPKSFEVLRLLVEKHGVLVSKKELLDLVWGHTIVTEGSVTQCVIDVRRAIGDDAQRMVRTVPRRGYVFTAPVVETATEPDTPAEPAVVSASSAPASLPSSVSILIAAATLMVTGIVEQRARQPSGESLPVDAPDTGGSIAVLPFVDMSASGDQQFLSDGIAEEIIDRLAQAGRLRVVARTSSFALRDPQLDVPAIASKLHVDYVLEGSVRRSGNRVRVTAQLVDASRNTHVWSNTYNRDLGDLFAVQDDIASKVAVALQSTLEKLGVNGAEPDPQAYPHFLAGRFNRHTPGDLERAVRNLEQAVALDPEYADAWVMLSGAYRALAWDAARPAEWRQRQRDAALRAIAVDPALWSAQVRLATYYFEVGDRVRALEHFRHASKLKPDDPWLARFENGFPPCSADLDMFVAMHRKAAETDPLSATARRNLGVMLFASGQLDEALTEFQRSQDLAADSATSLEVGRVLLAQRRDDDAYREFMQLPSGEYRDYGLALMQGVPAHRAEADAALRRLARLPGDPMHGLRVAEAYVLRAQPDRSFEWLQRTRDGLPRDESLFARVCDLQLEMSLSPFLKPLQADARWAALMANGA